MMGRLRFLRIKDKVLGKLVTLMLPGRQELMAP